MDALFASTTADPALLAFVKCHLSSFLRWDLLRTLAERPGAWVEAAEIGAQLHKPLPAVRHTLEELAAERIVEEQVCEDGRLLYRLDPDDPTSRVVSRLIAASARDQRLRQVIIARILHGSHSAA